MSFRSLPALAALAALADCEPGETTESTTAIETSSFASTLLATQHRMHVRFEAAKQIELAIAWNSLDHARSEANALALLDEPNILPAWQPYLDDIQESARDIRRATDVVSAAKLVGTLGQRCAACHVALDAHVNFPAEPAPAIDLQIGVTMGDHQWAAMQMWEGLIGPSDQRWVAGANALTTVPPNPIAQAITPSSAADVDDVTRVRGDAKRALVMTSSQDRAVLFGGLLASCAHCHALLRDR